MTVGFGRIKGAPASTGGCGLLEAGEFSGAVLAGKTGDELPRARSPKVRNSSIVPLTFESAALVEPMLYITRGRRLCI
jgi:hypothetical protein